MDRTVNGASKRREHFELLILAVLAKTKTTVHSR